MYDFLNLDFKVATQWLCMTKIVVIISIKCWKTQIVDYNIICNIYNSASTDKIAPVQIMIIIIYYGLLLIFCSLAGSSRRIWAITQ